LRIGCFADGARAFHVCERIDQLRFGAVKEFVRPGHLLREQSLLCENTGV
jgi:hypothetical protein